MTDPSFSLAGAELAWPMGSAAGMTNHPDVEAVAHRLDNLMQTGLSFCLLGSWTLGDVGAGNAYLKTENGWDYLGGDEYLDLQRSAGYNAKRLPNPGTDAGMQRLEDFMDMAASRGVELGVSFSPHAGEPLEELPEIMRLAKTALDKKVLFVEVNLSCPNVEGRLPFYQDEESMSEFISDLAEQPVLLNKHGLPGVYFKDGPVSNGQEVLSLPHGYGRVTSNTYGNQQPLLPDGSPAIKVNNGKAGMSGPTLKSHGRVQLSIRRQDVRLSNYPEAETISVLGVSEGREVNWRLNLGASAVELASVLYWPQLRGCDSAGEVVETIKQEYIESYDRNG